MHSVGFSPVVVSLTLQICCVSHVLSIGWQRRETRDEDVQYKSIYMCGLFVIVLFVFPAGNAICVQAGSAGKRGAM